MDAETDAISSLEKEFGLSRSSIKPQGRIIDVGCGQGRRSIALAKEGFQVLAIDSKQRLVDSLKTASSRLGLSSLKATKSRAEDLPVDSESFDAVLITEVLEHVDDFEKTLDEVSRVLKPGGSAFISVPTRRTENILSYLDSRFLESCGHRRIISLPALLSELQQRSLEVQFVIKKNFFWFVFWLGHVILGSRPNDLGLTKDSPWFTSLMLNSWCVLDRLRLTGLINKLMNPFLGKSYYIHATKK